MDLTRSEALDHARRLCRTLGSTPDPRRQAEAMLSGLLKVRDWPKGTQAELLALAQWLAERPPIDSLKPRCRRVLELIERDG